MSKANWLDDLFGKKGTKGRAEFERFCRAKNRRIKHLKASGKWPKVGQIYWNPRDEELHVVIDAKGKMVWTQYGNKHIAACGHSELHPDFYFYVGKL